MPSRALLVAALAVPLMAQPAHALPGDLDPTFGTGGKVTTDFAGLPDTASAVAVQSDGRIVAAGTTGPFGNRAFALARYRANGTLDASFGSGGKVTTDFGGDGVFATAVAVQPDGRILAAGFANRDFALVRYNPDGTPDDSFGSGGKVTTDFFGSSDGVWDIAVQADGKIVAAGWAVKPASPVAPPVSDFALARYNADGSLDATFGFGGKVTTDYGGESDHAYAMVLQPDGKIVAVGTITVEEVDTAFALARYNPDGSPDTSFGSGGKVVTHIGDCCDLAHAAVLQPDGRIIAAGMANSSDGIGFALVRYNQDGTIDNTFGAGGTVITQFTDSQDTAFAVALQSDGKIVAAGGAPSSLQMDFAVARYRSDGSLDARFGSGGRVTTDFGGQDGAAAIAIQPNGRIIAVGSTDATPTGDFALARYKAGRRPVP